MWESKGRTYRSKEEKKEIVARIEEGVRQGTAVSAACGAEGITLDRFYRWRKRFSSIPVIDAGASKAVTNHKQTQTKTTAPQNKKENRVAVIYGSVDQVRQILAGL